MDIEGLYERVGRSLKPDWMPLTTHDLAEVRIALLEVKRLRNENLQLEQQLAEAKEVIDWYSKWDWSDKYVQAVSQRAREWQKKWGGE